MLKPCRTEYATRTGRALMTLVAALVLVVGGSMPASAAPQQVATPYTWGDNQYGQLGDGTHNDRLVPGPVAIITDASDVAGGREHALALRASGTVWSWGRNTYGQLGDGTKLSRSSPTQVGSLIAVEVDAGHYHSMARLGDGTLWAWGVTRPAPLGMERSSIG